jgi:ribonuclease VapC
LTLFADASALISILTQESDALSLADCLNHDRDRLYSALSAWETVAGLCRSHEFSPEQARDRLRLFSGELGFPLVSIGEVEFAIAIDT